jgi:CO/xanthine dehydrogenase FAD-binding subunit
MRKGAESMTKEEIRDRLKQDQVDYILLQYVDIHLVSVAIGYALDARHIRQARVVPGGVAPVPWRDPTAEAMLEDQQSSPKPATAAATALADAQALSHNAFNRLTSPFPVR